MPTSYIDTNPASSWRTPESPFQPSSTPVNSSNNFWSGLLNFGGKALNFISKNANPLAFIGNAVGNLFNYGQQLANYNYQKSLQQKIFDREDTSFSRLARDYESAGFSPVLALGHSAGSGSVVNTNAPEIKNDALARVGVLNALNYQNQQIQAIKKDNDLKDVEIDTKRLDNKLKSELFTDYSAQAKLKTEYQRQLLNLVENNTELKKALANLASKKASHYEEELILKTFRDYFDLGLRFGNYVK